MDYPIPEPRPPLACPWPVCEAVLAPVAHLVEPGSQDVVWVYPIHEVVGPSSWYGRCLTSQFQIIYTDDGGYRLTAYATAWLRDRSVLYARQLLERAIERRRNTPGTKPFSMDELLEEIYRDDSTGALASGASVHGADRHEPPETDDYFPGRPADAPEPGVGESPAAKVPDHATGQRLGRAEVENAHQTAKGLAALAVNQMGSTQDLLARLTEALESAAIIAEAARSRAGAVQGLVTACVGTGSGTSAAGEKMAEHTAMAASTLAGDANVLAAVHLALARVSAAHAQLAAAAQSGRAYISTLS